MTIDSNIGKNKAFLLEYFRDRSNEAVSESVSLYAESQYKERASYVNQQILLAKDNFIKAIEQKHKKENWDDKALLEGVLLSTYVSYITMLESRNEVWEYEYMSFARRIGELWEPFCLLTWEYPLNKNLEYIIPPLFSDVKEKLAKELEDYIETLPLSEMQKRELMNYYQKVWTLVTSGEIKLELDLHFALNSQKYNVDFKSGFSSNEKGNTNRLLLVASIYHILEENYKCELFVRADEDKNNHYLQTLKNSGLWEVFCGRDTYEQIQNYTGFDLFMWIQQNITWESDFSDKFYKQLKDNSLIQYLEW